MIIILRGTREGKLSRPYVETYAVPVVLRAHVVAFVFAKASLECLLHMHLMQVLGDSLLLRRTQLTRARCSNNIIPDGQLPSVSGG